MSTTQGWKKRDAYEPDITIVVALFDGRQTGVPHSVGIYTSEWVDKLYRGIARNYTGKFDFVCLTEMNYDFVEPIKQVRFSRSVDQYGWMSLMEWYRPDICTGNRVTMGLDTIITGPLDDIFNWTGNDDYILRKAAVCQDPFHPDEICNAMTLVTPAFCDEIWNYWLDNEYEEMRECKLTFVDGTKASSEMVLLRKLYSASPRIDTFFPGRIVSYKAHIGSEGDLIKMEYHSQIEARRRRLDNSSIVYFHGKPKPHELTEDWVKVHWV